MPKPTIPYIDGDKLRSQADRLIPLIEAVDTFVPGASEVNSVLNVLQGIVDNDSIRTPVVDLINKLSGAQKPV